jgi:hypothetical protein
MESSLLTHHEVLTVASRAEATAHGGGGSVPPGAGGAGCTVASFQA